MRFMVRWVTCSTIGSASKAHTVRQATTLLVALSIILIISASPAGANCVRRHPGLPWGSGWTYFTGTSGGQIQCANRAASFGLDIGWSADSQGKAWAMKDIYCANPFALPAGWVQSVSFIQQWNGTAWVNIVQSPTQSNTNGTNTNQTNSDAFLGFPLPGKYQGVSIMQVAVAGGWQIGGWNSGSCS